jgi:hypothetical protein
MLQYMTVIQEQEITDQMELPVLQKNIVANYCARSWVSRNVSQRMPGKIEGLKRARVRTSLLIIIGQLIYIYASEFPLVPSVSALLDQIGKTPASNPTAVTHMVTELQSDIGIEYNTPQTPPGKVSYDGGIYFLSFFQFRSML